MSWPERSVPANRLAVLGCSYGNRRAVLACIDDARHHDVEVLASCGDMIGFCGGSGAACDLVREQFAVAIAGNHEREAAAGSLLCGCGHSDPEDERLSCAAAAAQLDGLDTGHQEWMAGLPEVLVVRTPASAVLLAHGSPDRLNEFLYEQTLDPARARAWLDRADARLLVVSHSGLPWIMDLGHGRLAVNCGAAGKPDHDGDQAVHYALIDTASGSAEIRRVVYDHVATAADLRRNGYDPRFIAVLETGRWSWGVGSLPAAERDRPARGPSFLPAEIFA